MGCALCLIGSLIIILHAPEDKDIETVDEVLRYAVQPGVHDTLYIKFSPDTTIRIPHVLLFCSRVLPRHDLLRRASLRSLKSTRIHLYLLPRGIRLHHGRQGLWHRGQTHNCW